MARTIAWLTESVSLSYHYERHHESEIQLERGSGVARREINIIDLGMISPDGAQVGASGSDKTSIMLSETSATPGYQLVDPDMPAGGLKRYPPLLFQTVRTMCTSPILPLSMNRVRTRGELNPPWEGSPSGVPWNGFTDESAGMKIL